MGHCTSRCCKLRLCYPVSWPKGWPPGLCWTAPRPGGGNGRFREGYVPKHGRRYLRYWKIPCTARAIPEIPNDLWSALPPSCAWARQVVHNHQTIWVDVQLCISSSSAPGYFSAKDIVLHRLQLCKENHWSTRQLEILIRIRYLETNAVRCLSWWMGAAQFQVWQLTSFICTLQSHAHPACLTSQRGVVVHDTKLHLHHGANLHGLHHRFQRMCQSTFDKGMWLWWQSDAARSVPSQSIGAAHSRSKGRHHQDMRCFGFQICETQHATASTICTTRSGEAKCFGSRHRITE